MRKVCFILLLMSFGATALAQSDTTLPGRKNYVTFRIHPARLLYGFNSGFDFRIGKNAMFGVLYQYHGRDFISPIRTLEIDLRPSQGHFLAAQLYLETRTVMWHGPRIAVKDITFPTSTYGDADDAEGTYELARDQQNWYATYSFGLKRIDPGFYVSANVTAGLVWFRAKDVYRLEGEQNYNVVEANQIYPHILLELAIGFSI
ncbi:hypothetical protein [Phaeocystidibacter luteus]|uniref:DUF3575 domain-containing protein n=1 Tax=Phaeocystidibacter luteus TaxID=911197 RepID=A0A6N6RDL8_9FLAO|nr:hypothetical protein [Phaeocystidibacter luteus]KAB2807018.1 hypothetical protein F8C67_12540 [Phaeocystidibacter luteus]